jgi:hypothetical protein
MTSKGASRASADSASELVSRKRQLPVPSSGPTGPKPATSARRSTVSGSITSTAEAPAPSASWTLKPPAAPISKVRAPGHSR